MLRFMILAIIVFTPTRVWSSANGGAPGQPPAFEDVCDSDDIWLVDPLTHEPNSTERIFQIDGWPKSAATYELVVEVSGQLKVSKDGVFSKNFDLESDTTHIVKISNIPEQGGSAKFIFFNNADCSEEFYFG